MGQLQAETMGRPGRMKGIDGGYKLSELLFGKGGSTDPIVNVTAVEFRFWAVVLTTFDVR